MDAVSASTAIGNVVDGRYELVSVLGEGGFGTVYKARQLATGQWVALKFMSGQGKRPTNAARERAERFRREMQLIGELRHPNIVGLVDSGVLTDALHGDQLFIVLEYIDGESLWDQMERRGPFPVSQALRLMTQVLEALAYAHARGVVHRDLKPQNIMVTEPGERCNARILDFGIATVVEGKRSGDYRTLTHGMQMPGTLAYMAPEQVGQGPLTPALDLFAWGLVFLECLTGRPTFEDSSPMQVVARCASSAPVELPREVDASELGPVLRRALEKDLAHRYAHAEEVLGDLERVDARTPELAALHETMRAAWAEARGAQPAADTADVAWAATEVASEAHRTGPADDATVTLDGPVPDVARWLRAPSSSDHAGITRPPGSVDASAAPAPRPEVRLPTAPTTEVAARAPRSGAALGVALGVAAIAVALSVWALLRSPQAPPAAGAAPVAAPLAPPAEVLAVEPPAPNLPQGDLVVGRLVPADAMVLLDGSALGSGEGTHRVAAGRHVLTIRASRYAAHVRTVVIPELGRLRVEAVSLVASPWPDGMAWFDAGAFEMGCRPDTDGCDQTGRPAHTVELDAYVIDQTEVSVEAYAGCVRAGRCSEPMAVPESCNWGVEARRHHPMNCVTWEQAQAYCDWRGLRLPTEAEWERAAGDGPGVYPWGDARPSCDQAVMAGGEDGCGLGTTDTVWARPESATPSGLLNVLGNVEEWVLDFHDPDAYVRGAARNPMGPGGGAHRIVRGGAYDDEQHKISPYRRDFETPLNAEADIGIRCAGPLTASVRGAW